VLCSLPLISASSFYSSQPWILFLKWTISYKTHTVHNYYITAQHSFKCAASAFFQRLVNNKIHNKKSYSQDHSAQTQHTERTAWLETANWESQLQQLSVPSATTQTPRWKTLLQTVVRFYFF
jgi:hypothetical protein